MVCLVLTCCRVLCFIFCFFKQKTAYEMRISDWSSDVCSSDVQNALLLGKVFSAADIIDGGDGVDTLILLNADIGADNALEDNDFTNVSNVEAIQTNYDDVTLGAKAAAAGIVSVDTSLKTTGGTSLDIRDRQSTRLNSSH